MTDDKNRVRNEFALWQSCKPELMESLPVSGSNRRYYRLSLKAKTYIGVYNENKRENIAFFEMTKHFQKYKIAVPELFYISENQLIYFVQDLGDTVLFDVLSKGRTGDEISESVLNLYKKSLQELIKLQVLAGKDYDFKYTYPVAAFDRQAILWDLNYFKYYYAKLMGVDFDEFKLQHDFETLADRLLKAPSDFFMFRDFQSRNIMIHNDEVYFIDYQGGRKGALQYDVASLLWQARANLPKTIKQQLFDFYLDTLKTYIDFDTKTFTEDYHLFVLIRVLQTLGAYGFRGLYEHKTHFVLSLPLAIENLRQIVESTEVLSEFPELNKLLQNLLKENFQPWLKQTPESDILNVYVGSFSYKKGLPKNYTGHGGGHIFDCRAIHNPGRYAEYKQLTGRDKAVIDFLDKSTEMHDFLESVKSIAEQSVDKYLQRGFNHLSIYFGCTGGQHRSVYSAEKIFEHLKNKYPVRLVLEHREQNIFTIDYGKENV